MATGSSICGSSHTIVPRAPNATVRSDSRPEPPDRGQQLAVEPIGPLGIALVLRRPAAERAVSIEDHHRPRIVRRDRPDRRRLQPRPLQPLRLPRLRRKHSHSRYRHHHANLRIFHPLDGGPNRRRSPQQAWSARNRVIPTPRRSTPFRLNVGGCRPQQRENARFPAYRLIPAPFRV